ncbi:MAG: hypothetical protein AB1437_24650 [Pseudomonadota bacterium]
MEAMIVGMPIDGLDIPPNNLGDGPPMGEDTDYDSLPPNEQDWFGALMTESGLDDNVYFEKWNEETNNFAFDMTEWSIENGDTKSWGVNHSVTAGGYVFDGENSVAETRDGNETWRMTLSYHGQTVFSAVQVYDESVNGMRSTFTDGEGNVLKTALLHNVRLSSHPKFIVNLLPKPLIKE